MTHNANGPVISEADLEAEFNTSLNEGTNRNFQVKIFESFRG